ncbi:glycoside hydrolase family 10 protein [Streptomyces sp. NRRL B-24484]|uniref:glycoside hydrolase family 10 protein n=1 Tax=Streptomyces sp. NRRL B-24484 TaxID=1463833 RepID=UPI000694580F|nr:family 10 glycosylhydrolase [Streptomyces sp. NRRL B-24484]
MTAAHRRPGRREVLAALAALAAAVCTGAAAPPAPGPVPGRPEEDPPGTLPAPAVAPHPVKRQMRGLWIACLNHTDWPDRRRLGAEQIRADFEALLDSAVATGFNAVFVQVRPTADALWPSRLEPWSQWLTGVQGQDPGWDPLAFAVRAAHERGLAFHAWFNPFRVAIHADPGRLVADHPARRNPHWALAYDGELYYDPGLAEVRAFVLDAVMDAVTRYEVDGVHIDDYFYPYPAPDGRGFPDDRSFAAEARGFTDRAAWRRDNIDLTVRQLRDRVRAARPDAVYGISPFGVWRNRSTDPAGSATTALQSYDAQFCDSRGWVRKGWVDYIAPQLYWHIGFEIADYAVLARWWAAQAAGTDTQVWIGQSASRPGAPGRPAPWQDPAELSRHLALNEAVGSIGGDVFFSARSARTDRIGAIRRLAADHWSRPALVPLLPRLAGTAPPAAPALHPSPDRRDLQITPPPRSGRPHAFRFAVYGYAEDPGPRPPADPARLVALLPALTVRRYRPPSAATGPWYAVSCTDRAGREGPTSAPVRLPAG